MNTPTVFAGVPGGTETLIRYGLVLLLAFLLTAILTGRLIPLMHRKQFQQYERELGPETHKKKTGTPSMGGIAIIIGVAVALPFGLLCTRPLGLAMPADVGSWVRVLSPLVVMVAFGLIGFLDDYEKAIKKNNLGLNPKQKLLLQLIVSLAFALLAARYSMSGEAGESSTAIWIPGFDVRLELGWLYVPFVVFVMVAMSNAVNLTDGLDGLASGVTAIVSCTMALIAALLGCGSEGMLFAAVVGACLGFLIYNRNPARIFMGDTGSMALGGALAACAVMMKAEFLLAIAGFIYVLEALSVIIQVVCFKATGKRVFRMAPLHHHFELGGMSERKVVLGFWIATLVFCLLAGLTLLPVLSR